MEQGYRLEVEPRRRLGLPSDILDKANLNPHDQVLVTVHKDNRITIKPLTHVIDQFNGSIPGLADAFSTTALPESAKAGTE